MSEPRSSNSNLRPPKQARSRDSLQRILDAAYSLLDTREIEDITLREIADSAEVSQSSLYARFASKDALLDHVHEQLCEERRAEARGIIAGMEAEPPSPEEAAFRMVRGFITRLRSKGAMERRLIRAGYVIESIKKREEQFQRQQAELARSFALHMAGPLSSVIEPKLDAAIHLVMAAAPELTEPRDSLMLEPLLSDDELARKLSEMVLRSLGYEPGSGVPDRS